MYRLPKSVTTTDGVVHDITEQGDYRMVLDCFEALNDMELSEDEQVLACLLIFYNEFTCIEDILDIEKDYASELVKEMFKFFNCGREDSVGAKTDHKLIDWAEDEHMITAAINNVAGKEVRELDYLHWWTFMGYYMSIGESVLSTVVGIRDKILNGKKLEKYEKDFRTKNPHYFTWNHKTRDQVEAEEFVNSVWNKEV